MRRVVLVIVLTLLAAFGGAASTRAAAAPGVPLAVSDVVDAAIGQVGRWQSRMNRALAGEVRDIKRGAGLPAVLALLALGFAYGVVHALGPGHGKTVVAAYFMDRSRHWSSAIFAGGWIALGHVVSAVLIVLVLAAILGAASLDVLDRARLIEIVAYGMIAAIGLWRLIAGLRGHAHDHHHHHGHDHHHHHHNHNHDHAHADAHDHPAGPSPIGWRQRLRQFLRPDAMLGMLTVAAAVPCSGSMILLLFALANGMLAVGLLATLSIALGMGLTLIALGFAAVALRLRLVDRPGHAWLERGVTIAGGLLVTVAGGLMLAVAVSRPV